MNFDKLINRENTNSYKYDMRQQIFNSPDVLPMWVADGDFEAPQCVLDAIADRLKHGVLGYTFKGSGYFEAIMQWNLKRHNWPIEKDWIEYSPGVVPSLNLAVMQLTAPGDEVIVQSPVYFPFYSAITVHKRKVIKNSLVLKNGRYQMDLESLKSSITKKTKLIFLCSPHNPTGNVWQRQELLDLCQLCLKNKIIIISDEIHADILFKGYKHIPTASLSNEISQNTITLMAPSKTFNIAGLSSSYIVSENKTLLDKITKPLKDLHMTQGNIFGITATVAAYNRAAGWLESFLNYITGNYNYVNVFLTKNLPNIKLVKPEGTYLLWLNFSAYGLKQDELNKKLVHEAKLGLSTGEIFGKEGIGFQRMNIACPKSNVETAMKMLKKVF